MSSKDLDCTKWITIVFSDSEAQASCMARWPSGPTDPILLAWEKEKQSSEREREKLRQWLLQLQLLILFQTWAQWWSGCQKNNTYSSQGELPRIWWWFASIHVDCLVSFQKMDEAQFNFFLQYHLKNIFHDFFMPLLLQVWFVYQWHRRHSQQVRNVESWNPLQTQ